MNRRILITGILALVGVFSLFTGCAMKQPTVNEEGQALVELTIVDEGVATKMINPVQEMKVDEYRLEIDVDNNPATAPMMSIGPYKYTGAVVKVSVFMKPGSYYFKAIGYNTDKFRVGEGTAGPVSIFSKEVPNQTVNLKVVPADGTGIADLKVTWPNITFNQAPSVSGVLENLLTGAKRDIVFAPVDPNTARYFTDGTVNALIDDGYYKLYVKLLNNAGDRLWSTWEGIRFIAGGSSEKTWTLEQQLYGIVTVNFDLPDLQNSAKVYFITDGDPVVGAGEATFPASYDDALFPYAVVFGNTLVVNAFVYQENGTTQINTATTTETTDSLVFEWYFDGDTNTFAPGSGSNEGVNSVVRVNTSIGFHTLDLLVTWTRVDGVKILTSRRINWNVQ